MRIGASGNGSSFQVASISAKADSGAKYAAAAGSTNAGGNAADELEAYVKMTPAQRMRYELLKKLGITEDDLGKMTPDQRKGVETKLADLVKQEMAKAQKAQQTAPKIDTYA
jgi:hypothetical protein